MATPSNKVKCPHCPLKINVSKLQDHLFRCELNKLIVCDIPMCGRRFSTLDGMNKHKGLYHTAEERGTKHNCKYCSHGSDDLSKLKKHENIHVEAGGPGFHSRSRSRSRVPVSASNLEETTSTIPKRRSRSGNPTQNQQAHSNNPTPQNRRSLRSRSPKAQPQDTFQINQSIPLNTNKDNRLIFAQQHPNVIQQMIGQGETPTSSQNQSLQINKNGLFEISILNLDYAERRIQQYKDQYNDIFRRTRVQNKQIREVCMANGIELNNIDRIEEKIQEYEAKYGQLPPMDENDE